MPAVLTPEAAIDRIRGFLASGQRFKVELVFVPLDESAPASTSPDERRRALARARQQRFRDARSRNAGNALVTRDSVTTPPDPLGQRGLSDSANRAGKPEEGDREAGARGEKPVTHNASRNASRGGKSRRQKDVTERPADLAPTPEQRERAARTGLKCDEEFERFCASTDARGVLYASWTGAFTTWLINEVKFAAERASKGGSGGPRDRVPVQRTPVFDYSKWTGKPNGAPK